MHVLIHEMILTWTELKVREKIEFKPQWTKETNVSQRVRGTLPTCDYILEQEEEKRKTKKITFYKLKKRRLIGDW